MDNESRTYIAIDLKSFYASVECVARGLDPLTTNLVVADQSRTEKTICLAVTPSLKAYGISGRARLFEVVQRLKEVNNERRVLSGWHLTGKSTDDRELKTHPDWEIDYLVAPPRMAHYIDVSTTIYMIYLKYVAPEDIHVYSIDEVFMDVTPYLKTYRKTAHELAMTIIRDVLQTTGITATAGIGTNLYLAKVAMDIVAKHAPADKDGVRIGELNEMTYRERLWNHKPLTSFWRVGSGTAAKLALYGIDTMGKLARKSIENEGLLYNLFGVNAELLIDHAWGWEPCTIAQVKAYKPETNSFSNGQVLTSPYDYNKARVVVKEMAEAMALKLVEHRQMTNQVVLTIGYDRESLSSQGSNNVYKGPVSIDRYGRKVPKPAHGTETLKTYSSSTRSITEAAMKIYDSVVDSHLLVRRIYLNVNHVVDEQIVAKHSSVRQLSLFDDHKITEEQERREEAALKKERRMQEVQIAIKERFGNNALLKGINFEEGATAKDRNQQIGGHKA